jgi:hypothetical protein
MPIMVVKHVPVSPYAEAEHLIGQLNLIQQFCLMPHLITTIISILTFSMTRAKFLAMTLLPRKPMTMSLTETRIRHLGFLFYSYQYQFRGALLSAGSLHLLH